MSATYDPTLPTNLDWVRFLSGDTDVTTPQLQDEEITAVLGAETATGAALPYFAAARVLSILHTRWSSAGRGVLEKKVGRLTIKRGASDTAESAIKGAICELRERGAALLSTRPRVFRVL